MSAGTTVLLDIGMEGGALLLIMRTLSLTDTFTGSHLVLSREKEKVRRGGGEGGEKKGGIGRVGGHGEMRGGGCGEMRGGRVWGDERREGVGR